MKRKQSTYYGTYYVYNIGASKMTIFRDQEDLDYFCFLVNEYSKKNKITILAYALCENSYHMVIRAQSGNFIDISNFIKNACGQYCRFFNKKSLTAYNKERSGVIFGAKFKSIPINNEKVLNHYIDYVHQKAIEKNINESAYCSIHKYINSKALLNKGIDVDTTHFNYADGKQDQENNEKIELYQGEYFLSCGVFVKKK